MMEVRCMFRTSGLGRSGPPGARAPAMPLTIDLFRAPAAAVVDPAGVRIVTLPAEGVERPMDGTLEVPAHLRLGVVEGEESLQFSTPTVPV